MPDTDTATSATKTDAQEMGRLAQEIERLTQSTNLATTELNNRARRIQELESYIQKHEWVGFLRGTFLLFWLLGVFTAFVLPTWMVVCHHANPWVLLFYIPAICFGGMFWETTPSR